MVRRVLAAKLALTALAAGGLAGAHGSVSWEVCAHKRKLEHGRGRAAYFACECLQRLQQSFEASMRYDGCPEPRWAACMCVSIGGAGEICHSVGDKATKRTSLTTRGQLLHTFTASYDLSMYERVTWNGHLCEGRAQGSIPALSPLDLSMYERVTCNGHLCQ